MVRKVTKLSVLFEEHVAEAIANQIASGNHIVLCASWKLDVSATPWTLKKGRRDYAVYPIGNKLDGVWHWLSLEDENSPARRVQCFAAELGIEELMDEGLFQTDRPTD